MNVDRRLPDGTRQEKELINKSQIYVNFLVKRLQQYKDYFSIYLNKILEGGKSLYYTIFIKLKI